MNNNNNKGYLRLDGVLRNIQYKRHKRKTKETPTVAIKRGQKGKSGRSTFMPNIPLTITTGKVIAPAMRAILHAHTSSSSSIHVQEVKAFGEAIYIVCKEDHTRIVSTLPPA